MRDRRHVGRLGGWTIFSDRSQNGCNWAAAEAGPGRLVPWLPVAFVLGVAVYFSADREPEIWAAGAFVLLCMAATFVLRKRSFVFAVVGLIAAAAAGFAIATLKSVQVAHPVLARPLFGVAVAGFVEVREERERTDRIVIAVRRMDAPRLETPLKRVRVSVRKGTAPPVGSFVSLKARLSPPLSPLRPGGYDFARDLYFQQIAATGFALVRFSGWRRRNCHPCACASRQASPAFATRLTRASARRCPATSARSPRR